MERFSPRRMKEFTGLTGFILTISIVVLALCPPVANALDATAARGYVIVTDTSTYSYGGTPPSTNGTNATATQNALQAAIDYAYLNDKIVYFPEGTYAIKDTLKCWSECGANDPDALNHVLIGATNGVNRPKIKLINWASGFDSASSPKPMIEFKNFEDMDASTKVEKEAQSYFHLLRGIDFDCSDDTGAVNDGAYGVYFNAAQDSSVENVRVDATGAFAGFVGLPGRAWGAVNIEVEGGQYGVDTNGCAAAGIMIAGAVFKNQTVGAIRYKSFAPLALVGFEIEATGHPALTVEALNPVNNHNVNLIDGKITISGTVTAAIDNSAGQNTYLRNVYVTGTNNLVKSGSQSTVTGSGTWKQIKEYSYCDQYTGDVLHDKDENPISRRARNLINGTTNTTAQPVVSVASANPPEDLVLRHRWASLPAVDDPNTVEAWNGTTVKGDGTNNDCAGLQAVIDANRGKPIFLRPGQYMIQPASPNLPGLTLYNDTILFGAARDKTLIAHRSAWQPTQETPLIVTANDANASTYVGDMSMGYYVNVSSGNYSWFNMLDWKAGANSMVHVGRPYTLPDDGGFDATQARSLLKVSESGGGRWYFPGCGEVKGVDNAAFRTFKADGTSQPLWIYGLNPEHEMSNSYTEFAGSNIRIYCVKSEDKLSNTWFKPIVTLTNAANVAMFGHGGIRDDAGCVPGAAEGTVEVNGTSDRITITQVVPQSAENVADGNTIEDNTSGGGVLDFPDALALFKKGTISDDDETLMKHQHIGYSSVSDEYTFADVGTVATAGSSGYGSGIITMRSSGIDAWTPSGQTTADKFSYLYKSVNGDCTIIARVLAQQNTGTYPKAGIMIRDNNEGSDTRAKFAHLLIQGGTQSPGTRFQYRASTDGSTTTDASGSNVSPYWLKLTRVGDTFTAYTSADGSNWGTAFGTENITMGSSVKIGLTLTSNTSGVLNTATFDNVSMTASQNFTLTYSAGTGGTISGTSPQSVSYGGNGTAVTADPNTGYHFVNWSDGRQDNPRTDTNVTANVSVTANFAIDTFTLTYTAGANGTISGTSPQTVNYNTSGSAVTAVPSTGYHFVNWSDGSSANPRTDTNVQADVTVTANFAINTYTLTYTAGANGAITGTSPQTVDHGASGTAVTAVPNTGYRFVDWSDASSANPRTDSNVTGNISVTANFAPNLPAPWVGGDINLSAPTPAGSASESVGVFTVNGAGVDIWGTADEFHFVRQSMSGACQITARVATQGTQGGTYPKAGVMIRETTTGGSKFAQVIVQSNGNRFQYRTSTDGTAANSGVNDTAVAPLWVRLKREGNLFTAYRSANGTAWTLVASQSITMNSSVLVGLCVSSNSDTVLNTSTFDNVTVESLATTPPAVPTGLSVTSALNGEVVLDWNDNTEGDLAGYNVYRSLSAGSGYAKINGSVLTSSGYTDPGRTNGTTYYYKVSAVDTESTPNESAQSAYVSATVVDTIAPATPTGLAATAGDTQVSLDWNNNAEGDLAGYNIYRSTTAGSGYTKINANLRTTSDYIDTGRTNGVTYYYKVTAVDNATTPNESAQTAYVSAMPVATAIFYCESTDAGYDGWVLESGENTNAGGSIDATANSTSSLRIGDDTAKKQYKSIVSFNTASLPDTATIVSATVKIKRGTLSNDPSGFEPIWCDVRAYGFSGNLALQTGDWETGAQQGVAMQAATMSYPGANGNWSTGSLDSAGIGQIPLNGRAQMRFYFNTDDDNDNKADYIGFYSGENATQANRPVLEITYY